MVKVPQYAERSDNTEAIEKRTQVLHDMGVLVQHWNRLELYVELEICRITKLSHLHGSIVLGGLMHKAKINILYALLREEGRSDVAAKLKTAMGYAKRNVLLHGAAASEEDGSRFAFIHRAVDDRYRVKSHEFTAESFHDHVWKFGHLADEALLAMGYDDADPSTLKALEDYGRDARFGAPA